jgi:hypothetical protein
VPEPKTICTLCVAGFPHHVDDCLNPEGADTPDGIEAAIKTAIMGRPPKDESDMDDPESTGRKRAASALPKEVLAGMICEWALLKEAGGGVFPVKGCHGNKATDRHHGPDKNTLNNERHENLHGICAFCHNEWHAKNDPTYEGERPKDGTPWLPVGEYCLHDPEGPKMSIKESLAYEILRYK